jgi:hypothetical protein
MDRRSHLMRFDLSQSPGSSAQIGPPQLDFSQRLSMATLGLSRVTRLKAALLFSFAYMLQQIIWYALSKPPDAAFGMFPRTSHCKGHVYHPCVPNG